MTALRRQQPNETSLFAHHTFGPRVLPPLMSICDQTHRQTDRWTCVRSNQS